MLLEITCSSIEEFQLVQQRLAKLPDKVSQQLTRAAYNQLWITGYGRGANGILYLPYGPDHMELSRDSLVVHYKDLILNMDIAPPIRIRYVS